MNLEIGGLYYRAAHTGCGIASVRKILDIKDDVVRYEALHGSYFLQQKRHGRVISETKKWHFHRWATGGQLQNDCSDFIKLDGAKIYATCLMLSNSDVPIMQCTIKTAKRYVAKQIAEQVNEGTIRLINKSVEEHLKKCLGNDTFLLAVQKQCCVCGICHNLTRHHVVPKRIKKNIPHETKRLMYNVLWVCAVCHRIYENILEENPSAIAVDLLPVDLVNALCRHFIESMKPQFLPKGWNIWGNHNDRVAGAKSGLQS